jgi:hypothetical protein
MLHLAVLPLEGDEVDDRHHRWISARVDVD